MIKESLSRMFNLDLLSKEWQSIRCPIHGDKNKSAGINFVLGYFNCFKCGSMKLEQLTERIGMDSNNLNDLLDREFLWAEKKDNVVYLNQITTLPVAKQLQAFEGFLKSRKLSLSTITDNKGYYVSDSSNPYYGHLVFPIGDGEIVGRRILKDNRPRFKNSEGTKLLLGLDSIQKFDKLIIVEGITDYLTLWELGFRNIVCSMGANLSNEQAYLLRGKTVYIIYDRDYAGHKGAIAAQKELGEFDAKGIIIRIPDHFVSSRSTKADISDVYCVGVSEIKEWLTEILRRCEESDSFYIQQLYKLDILKHYASSVRIIDTALNGGFTQGLYGIGGEPASGKSTIIQPSIRNFVNQKAKVLVETYEISKRQVWARYASQFSNFSWRELERDFSLLEPQIRARLDIDSNYLKVASDSSIEEFLARAANYDVIVVDYLQRMPSTERDPNKAIQINGKHLTQLAMSDKVVIVLSSMARVSYGDEDRIDIFKGSGDMEYAATAAMRLTKLGDERLYLKFTKNTRGKQPNGYLGVNWEHCLIGDITQ